MTKRVLTYCTAFLTGAAVWLALNAVNAMNPFLNWEYPFLRPFIGMTFPGGAPLDLHYLSHAARTWLPFLAAFLVSYVLTHRKAKFLGAVVMYLSFLIWWWGMMNLVKFGVEATPVFNIGLTVTFLGGLGLYLWLVSPVRSE